MGVGVPLATTGAGTARLYRQAQGMRRAVGAAQTGKHSPTGLLFYDGCTLAISVEADHSLIASLHVSFSGKAIRSPNGRDQIVLGR